MSRYPAITLSMIRRYQELLPVLMWDFLFRARREGRQRQARFVALYLSHREQRLIEEGE